MTIIHEGNPYNPTRIQWNKKGVLNTAHVISSNAKAEIEDELELNWLGKICTSWKIWGRPVGFPLILKFRMILEADLS